MSLKSWFLRSYSSVWAARWEFTTHMLVLWNLNLMATPPLLPWKRKTKTLGRSFYTAEELLAVDKPEDFETAFNSGGRSRLKILISDYCFEHWWAPGSSLLQCPEEYLLLETATASAEGITIASRKGALPNLTPSHAQLPFLPFCPWFQFPQSQLPPQRCSKQVLPSHTTGAWSPPAAQVSPEKKTLVHQCCTGRGLLGEGTSIHNRGHQKESFRIIQCTSRAHSAQPPAAQPRKELGATSVEEVEAQSKRSYSTDTLMEGNSLLQQRQETKQTYGAGAKTQAVFLPKYLHSSLHHIL